MSKAATSKETSRLRALAGRLSEGSISERRNDASAPDTAAIEVHAPHGEKGDYLKVTATLSPQVYKLLSDEAQRRRLGRKQNAGLSAILRAAVVLALTRHHDELDALLDTME